MYACPDVAHLRATCAYRRSDGGAPSPKRVIGIFLKRNHEQRRRTHRYFSYKQQATKLRKGTDASHHRSPGDRAWARGCACGRVARGHRSLSLSQSIDSWRTLRVPFGGPHGAACGCANEAMLLAVREQAFAVDGDLGSRGQGCGWRRCEGGLGQGGGSRFGLRGVVWHRWRGCAGVGASHTQTHTQTHTQEDITSHSTLPLCRDPLPPALC